jgi:4-hydroxybenzoate polyprenyltransferase
MREIPSGKLSVQSSALFVVLSGGIFIIAAAMLGKLCLYLSFPVLIALYLYSFTKRFTWLCHLYLGLAISLSPVGAWIAVTGSLSFPIVLLSLALLTHISGFDILYACQDIDFDKKEGLHSMPAALGPEKAMQISTGLHVATWLFFMALYFAFNLNGFYLVIVFIIGGLLVIEHRLVNPEDLSHVNIAFFHINSIISVLLITAVVGGVL